MRIGYLIDVNKGAVRPADAAARRRAPHARADDRGGHRRREVGLPLAAGAPPPRAHRVLLPGAGAAPHDPRARDRQGRDRHVHVRRDALPPDACRRAVRDHRQPLQGPALHDDVARLPPGLLGPVRRSRTRRCSAASSRASRSGRRRSRASGSTSTASTGRSSRACSRPGPTRRAAGRSGAAATRAPRRSGARRSTARR